MTTSREPDENDHARVQAVLGPWWGGLKGDAGALERALLVPRLYFQHFTGTSRLVERDGELAAFLIGFVSQTDPATWYIHFVGVDPALRGQGIGRELYAWFFEQARRRGAKRVKCVTSPENTGSQAYHARLGFAASAPVPDYDGPGLARVVFTRELG